MDVLVKGYGDVYDLDTLGTSVPVQEMMFILKNWYQDVSVVRLPIL